MVSSQQVLVPTNFLDIHHRFLKCEIQKFSHTIKNFARKHYKTKAWARMKPRMNTRIVEPKLY
jgi:hypothetical protein